jgi:tRNA threonylcarbamoyladenosine biosynthesis protein TsaE
MKKILSIQYSLQEISIFAEKLQNLFWEKPRTIAGLSGDMGAGKTTFVSALSQSLGSKDIVSSPSYVLENQYTGKSDTGSCLIRHWDLYRLGDSAEAPEEILEPQISDYSSPETRFCEIVLIEWFEKCSLLNEVLDYVFHFELLPEENTEQNLRRFSLFSKETSETSGLIKQITLAISEKQR